MSLKVSASILAADLLNLANEITFCEDAKVDSIHFDVMDNHFVPNISFGAGLCSQLTKKTKLDVNIHLMTKPTTKELIKTFINAKANSITFHKESIEDSSEAIDLISFIKEHSCKVGIALNPNTSIESIIDLLHLIDEVLVMSVNPGFAGQKFMPDILSKIERLRKLFKGEITIDGGVNIDNSEAIKQAGASSIVVGSYLFNQGDYKATISRLKLV